MRSLCNSVESMKNFISKNNGVKQLMLSRRIAPLLGTLFIMAGCQTDPQTNFNTLAPGGIPKPIARAVQQAQAQPILLREGDTVNVVFPSSPTLDTTQQIRRDGKIVMPLIGEVDAAGKTPEDLQAELIKLYQPQVQTKQIIVTVQSSTYPVYVTGAVLRPGEIQANKPMTPLEAIMQAGGFDTTKANSKNVIIIRQEKNGTKKYTLNLKKLMEGTTEKPFYLEPSDIIFVPEKFQWF
jgi:polysaccharide export outer membrane protein